MAGDASVQSNNSSAVDPLMEQMRSILRLGPRASDPSQHRLRRFSDADRPSGENSFVPEPTAVRSSDGRWLPAPDEQSYRTVQRGRSRTPDRADALQTRPLTQHNCSIAVCAVAQVFKTTELLELIISFLETRDVLALRRTSRQWNATILESPQLRLHFFTYGQWGRPGSQFKLLPLSLPGLSMELGDEIHLGRWIIISFTPEAARRISPNPHPTRRVRSRSIFEGLRGGLGPSSSNTAWPAPRPVPVITSTLQYEELLISQPPVLGMQAFIVYSDLENVEPLSNEPDGGSDIDNLRACAKLSCDAGITLGFLAETAQSLLTSQPAGPSNAKDVRVVFKTIMSFCAAEQAPRKRTRNRMVTPIP